MSSTILIVGATGNTGKSAVRKLSSLLESKKSNHFSRILGLTRSMNSPASQSLAKLPFVEMQEKDWTTIDANWLKEQGVVRVYVAPHNLPHQFVDESRLYLALLDAGVKYLVKISTNVEFISPNNPIYYGRSHWAAENLLSQPEFRHLQWTSLRPHYFTPLYLTFVPDWIKQFKKTGEQTKFTTLLAADVPVALIDPNDVGEIGAHLLALDDPTPHNQAKYVLSGPEDVTGKQVLETVEKFIGTKVQDVEYKDTSFLTDLVVRGLYPEKHLSSLLEGCNPLWLGKCSLSGAPTSKKIIELAPPKRTFVDTLNDLVEEK
ncbi:hypothetical protein K7432_013852 [Basidiobolus ranarum]|uniref:NmrA-like domain-containing protein n=1 Tax=Basidiobolus ranarum TaxID=34480 RepID=A0ABR2WIP9_9FUNG